MTGFRDAGMLVKFIANDEPVGATADTTLRRPCPGVRRKAREVTRNILAAHDNTAMLLTQAHICRPGLRAIAEEDGISSLKLSLIVPALRAD